MLHAVCSERIPGSEDREGWGVISTALEREKERRRDGKRVGVRGEGMREVRSREEIG